MAFLVFTAHLDGIFDAVPCCHPQLHRPNALRHRHRNAQPGLASRIAKHGRPALRPGLSDEYYVRRWRLRDPVRDFRSARLRTRRAHLLRSRRSAGHRRPHRRALRGRCVLRAPSSSFPFCFRFQTRATVKSCCFRSLTIRAACVPRNAGVSCLVGTIDGLSSLRRCLIGRTLYFVESCESSIGTL